MQTPAYGIVLDLRKAYDAIDWSRTLEILEGCGVGPNFWNLLTAYWDQQQMVARQTGFIVVDAIVRTGYPTLWITLQRPMDLVVS